MMIQRHRAAECLIFLFLVEQDKRSDVIGIRCRVIVGEAVVVAKRGIGSGNHVAKPRIFVAENLRVGVLLEDL